MSGWRAFILDFLRVPERPAPPPGARPAIFRAAPNYFYFRLILWGLGHLATLAMIVPFLVIGSGIGRAPRHIVILFTVIAAIGAVTILIRLTFGLAVLKLDFELRWYMISDRAIRIREGIVVVREKTIALANIQNTIVRQGPLQRMLGIADVEVSTAGGGSPQPQGQKGNLAEPMHVGYFRGVGNAAQIRSIILDGVRRHRDAGLGDPDDLAPHDAAEELLRETRLTRELLQKAVRS